MITLGQVRDLKFFKRRFEAISNLSLQSNKWNLQPGDQALCILSENHKELLSVQYGMVPFWSRTNITFYDAPIEGTPNQEPVLKKRIITTREFRRPIRETRCMVLADYFILDEGRKCYLFFNQDRSPIALAGVYDLWKEPGTKNEILGFALLTLPSYGMFKEVGLSRVPMILPGNSKRWIRKGMHLNDITDMMHSIEDKYINGYPVDAELIHSEKNEKIVVLPTGKHIRPAGKKYFRPRKGDSQPRIMPPSDGGFNTWNKNKTEGEK